MFPVKQGLTKIDIAFPTGVLECMPELSSIGAYDKKRDYERVISDWFYVGLKSLDVVPREGVNQGAAIAHIKWVMGSFEPKHEHKIAACAWLLNEWFSEVTAVSNTWSDR